MKQEGPVKIIIPAREVITCGMCKYYQHQLIRSGRNPIYQDTCTHESAPKHGLIGNLHTGINGDVVPGDWCPFEVIDRT